MNDVLFDRPRTEPGNFLTLPNHNRQVLVPCDLPVRLLRLVVVDNQGKTIPVTSSMKLFAFAGPGLYLVG